jgi:hypothetical protein
MGEPSTGMAELLELLVELVLDQPILGVLAILIIVVYVGSRLIGVVPTACGLLISAWIGWRFSQDRIIGLDLSRQEQPRDDSSAEAPSSAVSKDAGT